MNRASDSSHATAVAERRRREKESRRLEILEAAEAIFSEKGFHEASVEQIAAAANYGTGTIYLYFKDKEDLYASLLEKKFVELLATCEQRIAPVSDASEKLHILIRSRLEYFEQNRPFFTIYIRERLEMQSGTGQGCWANLAELCRQSSIQIEQVIREAQASSLITHGDPRLLTVALVGVIKEFTRDWINNGHDGSLSSQTDFIYKLILGRK